MIKLPNDSGHAFILLEDVISMFAQDMFNGYEIVDQGLFRLTRAAEMSLDEEQDQDFAQVMTEALRQRRMNDVVRAEFQASRALCQVLLETLRLDPKLIFDYDAWFDLSVISRLSFMPAYAHLGREPWKPVPVPEFEREKNIWEVISEKDVWMHCPYQSFDAFLRFIHQAAEDPDVLAIKQTLYRASSPSGVIEALEKAALNGKQVTVLVELKARFDEQSNIAWAHKLENAGATVLYGVTGLKVHAKACLVVRREATGIARYVHLGTGNYNEKTAKIYTDLSLFSCDPDLGSDITAFFNVVSGYSQPVGFKRIEMAPFRLRKKIQRLIAREIVRKNNGEEAGIVAKMNSLVDEEIIQALYRASQAGVSIKLNVRGICCLVPGIPGLSENIEVISIVDMFLEHSRVFYFHNGGDKEVYLSSADWMPRNFDRRLEIMFPLTDRDIARRVIDLLNSCFKDNAKAWKLLSDGNYLRLDAGGDKPFRVQEHLCRQARDQTKGRAAAAPIEIQPQRPKSQQD
jgi:polyphosphate kinase